MKRTGNIERTENYLLSESDIDEYTNRGILVPDFRLSDSVLREMQMTFEDLLALESIPNKQHILSPHLPMPSINGVPPRIASTVLEFALQPEILNIVEGVLGPNFVMWGCGYFGKPAHSGKEVPWHQDGQYWSIRPLAACTVWIALDQSGPSNGCLRVIPGSHNRQFLQKHTKSDDDGLVLDDVLNTSEFDEDEAMDVVLEPGQISIHDVYLIHGSMPNRSPNSRRGFAIRYMPTSSVYDRGLPDEEWLRSRPLFLASGEDVSQRNSGVVAMPTIRL